MKQSMYLIIHQTFQAVDGVKTEQKNWFRNPNSKQILETANFKTSVSNKDIETASVVIDLINDIILKNRHNVENVIDYYTTKYAEKCQQAFLMYNVRKKLDE